MTRNELTLLLYLETCAVDYGGKVEARRMNEAEFEIVEGWKATGFVQFGRVYAREIQRAKALRITRQETHWVVLSEAAWQAAHTERRARCARMMKDRKHQFNGVAA